jgi:hypothetical protein
MEALNRPTCTKTHQKRLLEQFHFMFMTAVKLLVATFSRLFFLFAPFSISFSYSLGRIIIIIIIIIVIVTLNPVTVR